MKTQIKLATAVLLSGLVIVLLVKISAWINPPDVHTVVIPRDSTFTPIEHDTYTPPVVPFIGGKKFPVRLPDGVKTSDVSRVVTVDLKPDSSGHPHQIAVIETKDGEVYVAKDSVIEKVRVTTVRPPLFALGFRPGVGLSAARRGERFVPSPMLSVGLVEWAGWIHAPVIMADRDGIGAGAQLRLYHDIFVGATHVLKYEGGSEIKLTASFNF